MASKSVAMCGDVGSVSLSDLRALEKGRPDDLSRVSSRVYLPSETSSRPPGVIGTSGLSSVRFSEGGGGNTWHDTCSKAWK